METVAVHFHLAPELGTLMRKSLRAGDDATDVKWLDVTDPESYADLHASHQSLVDIALSKMRESGPPMAHD
jgi:hypothetical protein